MVAQFKVNPRLTAKIAEIYNRLDSKIRGKLQSAQKCSSCGKCCNFAKFDHHLFITTPEMMYLAAKLSPENIKPMTTAICPYNSNGECTIYQHRFAGCRIFHCTANADFQSKLTESTLKELKSVCADFQIPYRYTKLATALNNFTSD